MKKLILSLFMSLCFVHSLYSVQSMMRSVRLARPFVRQIRNMSIRSKKDIVKNSKINRKVEDPYAEHADRMFRKTDSLKPSFAKTPETSKPIEIPQAIRASEFSEYSIKINTSNASLFKQWLTSATSSASLFKQWLINVTPSVPSNVLGKGLRYTPVAFAGSLGYAMAKDPSLLNRFNDRLEDAIFSACLFCGCTVPLLPFFVFSGPLTPVLIQFGLTVSTISVLASLKIGYHVAKKYEHIINAAQQDGPEGRLPKAVIAQAFNGLSDYNV